MYKKLLTFILAINCLLLFGNLSIAQTSDYKKAFDAYKRGDYKTAHKLILPLAENGFAQAQYSLGIMYEKGNGVKASLKKAKKWFKLAAEQGIAKAQYKLGLMHLKGQGVKKNYRKAIKWLKMSANQGNVKAQAGLGLIFENGQGVPQDYDKAIRWYQLAVDQGNAKAQKILTQLLKKRVKAQINLGLGIKFETGQGVPQDYNEAIRWYRLAADLGFQKGKEKLNLLLIKIKKNSQETSVSTENLSSLRESKTTSLKLPKKLSRSPHPGQNQIGLEKNKPAETTRPTNAQDSQEQIQNYSKNHSDSKTRKFSNPNDEFGEAFYTPNYFTETNNYIKEDVKDPSTFKEHMTRGSKITKQTIKLNDGATTSKEFFFNYLGKWIRAWENQNLESYYSFYAKDFKGRQEGHLDWKIARQVTIKKLTHISIDLKNIQIVQNQDEEIVKTNFIQTFKSDQYSDVVKKELVWGKYGIEWRIIKETALPIKN